MNLKDKYLIYIRDVRRYSARTYAVYDEVLTSFLAYCSDNEEVMDEDIKKFLVPGYVRNYEVYMLDTRKASAKTVNLHLSVISGFCRFLLSKKELESNPVKLISRPKMPKRLPSFFKKDLLDAYFEGTRQYADPEISFMGEGSDKVAEEYCIGLRNRLIIKLLYDTGIRRSELIGLNVSSVDLSRRVMRVLGKGNKMREIPLVPSLCKEISLYLRKTVEAGLNDISGEMPLILSKSGGRLYPMEVERIVKSELHGFGAVGKVSPHILRHTLATELLNDGAELNSIKELLGHSSLAATQVYTHNSIEKLKNVYNNAHPRAKKRR